MGQKINPHGLRVGVIKDWDSRWYARNDKVGDLIVEDHKIRVYLKKTLYSAGVPKIEIERDSTKVRIYIHCARPGVVIGRGGTEIERLRKEVEKMIGKPVALSIVEVRTPDTNAQLVAENIAQQLERRIGFRRAMKNAMVRSMRLGVKGIKVMCSGRLGGAEIARSECYHEGTIPLQTIRADIEYGFIEAATTYGRIGVKVWIYKGEVLSQTLRSTPRTLDLSRASENNRGDRRRGGRDNRGGYNRGGQSNYNRGGQSNYNRGGQNSGQSNYNRGGQNSTQGGQSNYNRGGQSSTQGGQSNYNRGGQNSTQGGQSNYNRGGQNSTQGGQSNYNRGGQNNTQGGQSNYNRGGQSNQSSQPRPAADSTRTEGGNA